MAIVVGIPSTNPGGLDAPFGTHFGHCDLYTVINVEDGDIKEIRTLPNVSHQEGGCLAPVQHLADNGVKILIAGGMGMRPLMGFNQAGIDVYYSGGVPTVGEAVQAFLAGKLQAFNTNQTCGNCEN
ncbi:dinitrogenase iron-molybdenum cofactor [bacterium BMS3Bbin14]|nr:dinitrogenase iron-molybdenum cofactor [bacterium BMS3Abin13]GBE53035.1 dinitrogenase iron-molybdenum cofactor [bacterium BMS3Bbin14]